jgi:type I restriction enzyme S subunit
MRFEAWLFRRRLSRAREIVSRTSKMLDSANTILARIEAANNRVVRSSQAVLARAFRGELIAVESDPHDM